MAERHYIRYYDPLEDIYEVKCVTGHWTGEIFLLTNMGLKPGDIVPKDPRDPFFYGKCPVCRLRLQIVQAPPTVSDTMLEGFWKDPTGQES